MRALRLTDSVAVPGPSVMGRPARLSFHPHKEPGWHWEAPSGTVWPLSVVHATSQSRRVRLEDPSGVLEVFEHIGPLLFTGLTGVLIRGSGWPPCFGETEGMWRKLLPHVSATEEELPLSTLRIGHRVSADEWGLRGFSIEPAAGTGIRVLIEVDYPGLGYATREYYLPDPSALARAFKARTLAWFPAYLRPFEEVIRLAGTWLDLPIATTSNWRGQFKGKEQKLLNLICLHRLLDILGSLSLLVPKGGMLGGLLISSSRAGHAQDMQVVTALRGEVIPIG